MTTAPQNPAPAVDRRALEDALLRWFAVASGLGVDRVFWPSAANVVRRSFPFGTMRWLSTEPVGTDSVVVVDLGTLGVDPDIRLSAEGLRRVTISIQCFDDVTSVGPPPESSPLLRLEAAIAKLWLPTFRGSLNRAGFGLASVTGAREVQPGQFVCEIAGYVTSSVTEDIYSIQKVGLTAGDDIDFLGSFEVPDNAALAPVAVRIGATAVVVDTEAEVLSLAVVPTPVLPASFGVFVDAGQRLYVWIPSSLSSSPTFSVGGFVGGFVIVAAITVSSVSGTLYRTVNTGLGSFTLEIS